MDGNLDRGAGSTGGARSNIVDLTQRTPQRMASEIPCTEPVVEINLIGGFSLTCNGATVSVPPAAQKLMALLALQGPQLTRARVAGVLWGERDEVQAAARLRTALWKANTDVPTIVATQTHLRLHSHVVITHQHLLEELRVRLDHPASFPRRIQDYVVPLRRELLADWYDEWTLIERERFRQARLHLFDELSNKLLDEERHAEAIDVALTVLDDEPFRNAPNQTLITAHLIEGNRMEALRQFQRYDELMLKEFGVNAPRNLRDMIGGQFTSRRDSTV